MQSLKMIWKAEVRISQEMYTDFKLIMWFTRLVGMFPLVVRKTRHGLVLKLSPWYIAYSFTFGFIIIGGGYYGELLDITSKHQDSIKVGKNTDVIVVLLAFTGFCLVNFCGIFMMPMKTLLFFDYIRCINQVDSIIHTTYKKSDRYKSVALLAVLVLGMIYLCITDTHMAYLVVGDKIGLAVIVKRTIGLDAVFALIAVVSYMNRHMAYSLEKRLLRLNELLEAQRKRVRTVKINAGWKLKRPLEFNSEDDAIVKLREAYLKLMDAVDILNDFLGLNTLIMIVSVMFLMTVSSYFLILLLEGKRRGSMAIVTRVQKMIMHFSRLLLLTEPWYACFVQAEILKGHVCSLSSGSIDRRFRQQIDSFATVLCLRPFEVSACGFFNVDRTLFTSMIETITTILVVLLQAEEEDAI